MTIKCVASFVKFMRCCNRGRVAHAPAIAGAYHMQAVIAPKIAFRSVSFGIPFAKCDPVSCFTSPCPSAGLTNEEAVAVVSCATLA